MRHILNWKSVARWCYYCHSVTTSTSLYNASNFSVITPIDKGEPFFSSSLFVSNEAHQRGNYLASKTWTSSSMWCTVAGPCICCWKHLYQTRGQYPPAHTACREEKSKHAFSEGNLFSAQMTLNGGRNQISIWQAQTCQKQSICHNMEMDTYLSCGS